MKSLQSSTLAYPPTLTLKQYLKGRDLSHPAEFSDSISKNAEELLERVNALLADLKITQAYVNSGWRPASINSAVGGKDHSLHMLGKAVDISDVNGSIAEQLLERPELLREHRLWLEDPAKTKGWIHLDTGERPARPVQIFEP